MYWAAQGAWTKAQITQETALRFPPPTHLAGRPEDRRVERMDPDPGIRYPAQPFRQSKMVRMAMAHQDRAHVLGRATEGRQCYHEPVPVSGEPGVD
jgi:hypothetical protein